MPKFELYFCPDHWGGPFGGPKLHEPSSYIRGSCPESLVARDHARLFGVAGLNPPGSVSTSLSDSSVSVSLIHACNGITPA